jgi:hypothetical protein
MTVYMLRQSCCIMRYILVGFNPVAIRAYLGISLVGHSTVSCITVCQRRLQIIRLCLAYTILPDREPSLILPMHPRKCQQPPMSRSEKLLHGSKTSLPSRASFQGVLDKSECLIRGSS